MTTLGCPLPPAFRLLTNWPVEIYYAEKKRLGTLTNRDHLYRFLANPASSRYSALFAAFILMLSIGSIGTFGKEQTLAATSIAGSIAELTSQDPSVDINELRSPLEDGAKGLGGAWSTWNAFLITVFTIELITRIIVYPAPLKDISIWIDTLCVIPLYAQLIVTRIIDRLPLELYLNPGVDHSFQQTVQMVACVVSLRMLKGVQFFLGAVVLERTIREALTALVIPVYLLFMLFSFFGECAPVSRRRVPEGEARARSRPHHYTPRPSACLVYLSARHCSSPTPTPAHPPHAACASLSRAGTLIFAFEYDPRNPDRVPDLATSWWMLLVTMTTVGYGDYSPQTWMGRCITGVAMVAGSVVMSMPLAIVGGIFTRAWESRTMTLVTEAIKVRLFEETERDMPRDTGDLRRVFSYFDEEGAGRFTYTQFKLALKKNFGMNFFSDSMLRRMCVAPACSAPCMHANV